MSKPSSNPRKKRTLGPPIDLDELYNAPNLRGMLSFLERPPEEARRRYEQKLAVDRAVAEQSGRVLPSPVENDQTPPDAAGPISALRTNRLSEHDQRIIPGSIPSGDAQIIGATEISRNESNVQGHGFSKAGLIRQSILKAVDIAGESRGDASPEPAPTPRNDAEATEATTSAEGLKPFMGQEPILKRSDEVKPTVDSTPAPGTVHPEGLHDSVCSQPTEGEVPTMGIYGYTVPTVGIKPTVGFPLTDGLGPTAGGSTRTAAFPKTTLGVRPTGANGRKIKLIRDVQDALSLAGQLL